MSKVDCGKLICDYADYADKAEKPEISTRSSATRKAVMATTSYKAGIIQPQKRGGPLYIGQHRIFCEGDADRMPWEEFKPTDDMFETP